MTVCCVYRYKNYYLYWIYCYNFNLSKNNLIAFESAKEEEVQNRNLSSEKFMSITTPVVSISFFSPFLTFR